VGGCSIPTWVVLGKGHALAQKRFEFCSLVKAVHIVHI